jgi:pimeloyl-ACP methyl ester carboxylesterase
MRVSTRLLVFSVVFGMFVLPAFSACLQSTLTTGVQSDGAPYGVWMPETGCWNGNFVVFAHGYVAPGGPLGVPTDELTIGGISLPATFNQLGYGFAASGYSKNGLAILQGVADSMDLVQNILKKQKQPPNRVYLIGASEGGLVATLSAEQLPHVYNAVGAACGPIGSFQSQINYFGDFRVLFDYFFPNVLPPSPVSIPQEVMTDWDSLYVGKIEKALAANPAAAAQLVKVMNAAVTSDPTTIGETILGALWYNAFATNDAVTTLGEQQPFDNHTRLYLGSSNDFLLNLKVARFTASPKALAAVKAGYETSGRLLMPTVTLHTTLDPVVPYWQETLYTPKTLFAGSFLERINLPVAAYGHCAFTGGEVLAAFGIIVLRDIGHSILTEIENTLAEPHRSDFLNAAGRAGLLR